MRKLLLAVLVASTFANAATEVRTVDFNSDGSVFIRPASGVPPVVVPPPVEQPPTVPPDVVIRQMPQAGTSTFLWFDAWVKYAFEVPLAAGSVEVGEGQGTPALPGKMSMSPIAGDFDYAKTLEASTTTLRGGRYFPCSVGGGQPPGKIVWTTNTNDSYDRCRISVSKKWYLNVVFEQSGNQVFGYRTN